MSDFAKKISQDPGYQKLVKSRSRYSWIMTGIMLFVYFGYICLVAFNKEFLARPIGEGVTTLSIPVGIGVIVFTVVITGIYVRKANSDFDKLNDKLVKDNK
jgi:uncharacterized membrane protein (DUF485 family)